VPRLADELPFYLLTRAAEHLPVGGGRQGRRGQGGAEGRSRRAAVGGSDRQRQRGREPPGCSRRKGWRVLRSGGCLPDGGWVIRPDTVLATTVHPPQVMDESCPKPSTTPGDSSSPQTRPSGAPSRTGPQASSGSIWTKTRPPRFQRWLPWQLGAEAPRRSADSSQLVTTSSTLLKPPSAGGFRSTGAPSLRINDAH
jgi:hypothetical protein